MKLPLTLLLGALALACGSRAALEAFDTTEEGKGGAASTSVSTADGPTVTSATSVSAVTTVGPATTSVTTGGSFCDNGGDCGFCLECSTGPGQCGPLWDDCFASLSCLDMLECINSCFVGALEPCLQQCAPLFPRGAAILEPAIFCTFCDECKSPCGFIVGDFCG